MCKMSLISFSDNTNVNESNYNDKTSKLSFWPSISFWFCLTYPLHTIQSRFLCLRYIRQISYDELILKGNDGTKYKRFMNTKLLPLLTSQPSPITLNRNFISLTTNSIAFVYKNEGLWGLYRGFPLSLLHMTARDTCHYLLFRYLYGPTKHIWRVLSSKFVKKFFNWRALLDSNINKMKYKKINSNFEVSNKAEDQGCNNIRKSESSGRNFVSEITRNDILDELNVDKLPKTNFSSLNFPQLLLKYFNELLVYPLLTCTTRLVVYEGPDLIGPFEIFELTYIFDGLRGFYRGFMPYIVSRCADDFAEIFVMNFCKNFNFSKIEIYTLKACFSALLGTLATPFSQLSVVQRCQSNIIGLCEYQPASTVITSMPWKAILFQFFFSMTLFGLNSLTLSTSLSSSSGIDENVEFEVNEETV